MTCWLIAFNDRQIKSFIINIIIIKSEAELQAALTHVNGCNVFVLLC